MQCCWQVMHVFTIARVLLRLSKYCQEYTFSKKIFQSNRKCLTISSIHAYVLWRDHVRIAIILRIWVLVGPRQSCLVFSFLQGTTQSNQPGAPRYQSLQGAQHAGGAVFALLGLTAGVHFSGPSDVLILTIHVVAHDWLQHTDAGMNAWQNKDIFIIVSTSAAWAIMEPSNILTRRQSDAMWIIRYGSWMTSL